MKPRLLAALTTAIPTRGSMKYLTQITAMIIDGFIPDERNPVEIQTYNLTVR